GSRTTASTCSAVMQACDAIREKLFRAAAAANDGPLAGRNASELALAQGRVTAARGGRESPEDTFRRLRTGAIEECAEFVPKGVKPGSVAALYAGTSVSTGGPEGEKTMYAMGAELVEVRVHTLTREIRVPRIVGAFAAGHLMNTRTTHSQLM